VLGQPADAAHVAAPAPAETPLWYQNGPEIEFPAPVVDDVVSITQANSFGYQWPGQVFHMPG